MPIFILKLIDRREVAKGTIVLSFEKPHGFTFKPGQYGGFTLINPTETDASGITRRFSLLSTPDDNHISIATRVHKNNRSYKRVLIELPLGSEIKFAGPTGVFTLHDDISVPAVFIAGGIGISPFYSMIRHTIKTKSPQSIYLFYGNAQPGEAAFLTELMQLQQDNPHFTLITTMDNADNTWKGETGFITPTMIKKYVPDLAAPIYYVCGAPVMVTALQETLVEMGIDEERIKVEDFPGY
jgi:ferredoxin-NADP reductase